MASRPPLPFWLCVLSLAFGARIGAAQEVAPRGEEKADLELWTRFKQQEAPLLKTDPKAAINDYVEFLRAGAKVTPGLNASVAIDAWDATIELVNRTLKDPDAALALTDEALALHDGQPRAAVLLSTKIRILVYEGRNALAQEVVEKNWAQVAQAPVSIARRIIWNGCIALQMQGKNAEIPALLKKAMVQNPLLLDEEYQSTNGWMYRYLVKDLLAQGKTDEALSWAKLRWMQCAFDDQHVQGAASLLLQVWQVQGLNQPQSQPLLQFITAQQNELPTPDNKTKAAHLANPLAAVATPAMDVPELQAQLERFASNAGDGLHEQQTHGRINLLILTGAWGEAMNEANQLWMNPATSTRGVKEITRIYKARDLNLVRANAFLDWLETNQGSNPVDKFFGENPLQSTAARLGGAA